MTRQKAPNLKAFCACQAIGIDVAKATLEVVGLSEAGTWFRSLPNTEVAIETLARTLSEGGYRHKLVCEATGHYHLLLGLVLARHKLDLRVVNPLQSSKHRQSRVRKTKTDRVDGEVLAGMGLTERALPPAADLQPEAVLIRLKMGQLQSLDKQLQALTRSLATYSETYHRLGLTPGESQMTLAEAVTTLKRARVRLQRELEGLLAASVGTDAELAALRRLPGFSPLVAGLVGTVLDRRARSARAWVAFVGLDVSVRESGVWRGRGKLTKRGNSYLRKRLYCAAWGAVMHYPEARRHYEALKAGGRNHVEALCILARKLLRIAYAVRVKGKQYDPEIAFAL